MRRQLVTAAIAVTTACSGLLTVSASGPPALAAATTAAVPAVTAVAGTWGKAVEVPGTAALNTGGAAAVSAVSCASAGDCAAGGSYTDAQGRQAFVASEASGTWHNSVEVPGLAALNTGNSARVDSISCTSPGNCAAGGSYMDSNYNGQAFVASEVAGIWRTAVEVPGLGALNAVVFGFARVTSISCASAGNCAAGGYYTDGDRNEHAFVASEASGTWGDAVEVPGLAALNTGDSAAVSSVSCTTAGNCAAVGSYTDSKGYFQAFVVSEVAGTWHNAIELPGTAALNTGGPAGAASVSCTSPENCAAGGSYTDAHGIQVFVASEVAGTWHNAIELPGTAALNTGGSATSGGSARITSISCASAGNCAAGGYYSDAQGRQAFVASETSGTWRSAIEVPGTAALNTAGAAQVDSISCASAGNCAAAGIYTVPADTTNGGDKQLAFVASDVNGHWIKAVTLSGTAALSPGVPFGGGASVSCASPGQCVAGGVYTDSKGNYQAFVASESVVTGRIRGYKYQCASDYRYRDAPGTPVVIHVCNTMLREKWTIGPARTLISHGLCLTDPRWGRWRTRQVLEPCTGWTNQQWTHKANGEYVSAVHHLCLTDPHWSTTAGTQLILQSCRDWTNQRWTRP